MTFTTTHNQYAIPHEGQPNWGDEIIAAWKDLDGDMRGVTDSGVIKDIGEFNTVIAESVASASNTADIVIHTETDSSRYVATGKSGVIAKDIDASTVIQTALDTVGGGTVVLSTLEYEITSTLTIPANVELRGQGISTTLRLADGVNTNVCEITGNWAKVTRLHIDGNKANNTSGHGIVIQGPTYRPSLQFVVVDNCAQDGILATGSVDNYNYETAIYSVQTKGHGRNGYKSEFTVDTYAAHLYAEDCGEHGIYELTAGNTYVHPHGYNCKNGIYLSPFASDIQLIAPYGETNRRRGIFVKASHCTITDPLAYDNSQTSAGVYNGILLDGASDITIHGGRSYNKSGNSTQDWGIQTVNNATDCRIWGLDTDNNLSGGFDIGGVRNILNGQSQNGGDPNTAGDWNGHASTAYDQGVFVWDTTTTPWREYKANGSGEWILNANSINQQHIVAEGDDIQATFDIMNKNDEVVIQGDHTITDTLFPPDDCTITINGTITMTDGLVKRIMWRQPSNPARNITIRGHGTLIGNKDSLGSEAGIQSGISFRGDCRNIHIKDIEIRDTRDALLAMGGGAGTDTVGQYVTLENIHAHGAGHATEFGDGFFLQCDDLRVDNCIVRNVTDTQFAIGNCQRFVLNGCIAYNTSAYNATYQQSKEVVGLGTQTRECEGAITGCVFGGPGTGFPTIREFSTSAPRRVTIAGNYLYGDCEDAIYLRNSSDCVIDGNVITGPSRHGIAVTNSTVTNNIIKNPGTNGIDCAGTGSSAIITGNKIVGAGGKGVVVQNARSRISDNTVINGANRGIDVFGNNCVISGNSVRNNTSFGINLAAEAQDCIINSNLCHKNDKEGIRLASGNNFCIVTANNLRDNTVAGIGGTVTADSIAANNIT